MTELNTVDEVVAETPKRRSRKRATKKSANYQLQTNEEKMEAKAKRASFRDTNEETKEETTPKRKRRTTTKKTTDTKKTPTRRRRTTKKEPVEVEQKDGVNKEEKQQKEVVNVEEMTSEPNKDTDTTNEEVVEDKQQEETEVVEPHVDQEAEKPQEATTSESKEEVVVEVPHVDNEVETPEEEKPVVEEILTDIEKVEEEDDLTHTQKIDTINESLPSDTRLGTITEDLNKPKLYHRLIDPTYCIAKAGEEVDFSFFTAFMRTFMKFGISLLIYIDLFAKALNREAFSYARMTFSDASWLWFRVVACGLIAELIVYFIAWIIAKLLRKKTTFRRIFSISSEAALSITVVYVLCGLLAHINNLFGLVGFAVASTYATLVHRDALRKATHVSKNQLYVMSMLGVACATLWILFFMKFAGGDLAQIFDVILNLS